MYINLPVHRRSLVAIAWYWIRMTASLLTLPGEILNPILLKGDFTKQDLSALSRVCKPLRQLTLPRLYEAIIFNWTSASSGTPKILFFLRSLLEKPYLSALVKHFRCIGRKKEGISYAKRSPGTLWEEGEMKTLEDGELFKMAKDVVLTADLPEPLLWIDAMEMGDIDVLVALILSQLPQLQTLHLDVNFLTNNRFIGFLFKHALSSNNQSSTRRCLSTFAHLRHVESIPALPEQSLPSRAFVDTDQFLSLILLPRDWDPWPVYSEPVGDIILAQRQFAVRLQPQDLEPSGLWSRRRGLEKGLIDDTKVGKTELQLAVRYRSSWRISSPIPWSHRTRQGPRPGANNAPASISIHTLLRKHSSGDGWRSILRHQ